MKPQHLSDLCLSTLGAVSLHQGVSDAPGIFSILFIVGGIWLVGISFFGASMVGRSVANLFCLNALGFSGSLIWIIGQWGASQWVLAWVVSVLWLFGALSVAIWISKELKN